MLKYIDLESWSYAYRSSWSTHTATDVLTCVCPWWLSPASANTSSSRYYTKSANPNLLDGAFRVRDYASAECCLRSGNIKSAGAGPDNSYGSTF